MPSLGISISNLIVLTIIVTMVVIALILLAVRFVHSPRNSLLGANGDLLERARELKAHGQIRDAVFLVRGETGMSHRSAVRFVRRL